MMMMKMMMMMIMMMKMMVMGMLSHCWAVQESATCSLVLLLSIAQLVAAA